MITWKGRKGIKMKHITKKIKVILGLVMIMCIVISSSVNALASTHDYSSENEIVTRAAICPSCHEGYLLSHTVDFGPYLQGSSVCSYRPDCLVTLYYTEHKKVTECTECSFGYTEDLNTTYTTKHSIYHY